MKGITAMAAVALMIVAPACSQQAEAPADRGAAGQGAAPAGGATALETAVAGIFKASCTSCHGGPRTPGKLTLDAAAFVEATVGVTSAQMDTLPLVQPGKPDRSYLLMKVNGDTRIKGRRMPMGADPLTDEQIRLIADWISALAAAPADTAAPAAAASDAGTGT
ncbi:MAG: hypothetical protein FJY74_07260 [Candidatus Eisenbacteria bacterium]|nr:hypothetical protein [Candidatus Eisenbacteria bacterium]